MGVRRFVLFVVVCGTLGVGTFTFFYVKYARITDQKIKEGPFAGMSLLYAAPRPVMLGDDARATEIAAYLRRCQYIGVEYQPCGMVQGAAGWD